MSGKPSRISRAATQALVGVGRRHADVDDRNVGLVHGHVAQQVVGRPGLADDDEADFLEQPHDPFAQEHRVVGDHDAPARAELRDRVAQRREVARQVVGQKLVDALGIGEARELVDAEIACLVARGEGRGGRREQDLSAVPRGRDPRGADEVDPDVSLLAELGCSRVEPDAHTHVQPARPRVVAQPALRLERRGDGARVPRRRRRRSRRRWSRPRGPAAASTAVRTMRRTAPRTSP